MTYRDLKKYEFRTNKELIPEIWAAKQINDRYLNDTITVRINPKTTGRPLQ